MSKSSFSKRTFRLLRGFCPRHLLEEIEGDLLQKFEKDKKAVGERKAKRKLFWNMIRFFRPDILLRMRGRKTIINDDMIGHFLKMFYRTSLRRGIYAYLNLAGLILALVSSFLIYLWIKDEYRTDNFHEKGKYLFRVYAKTTINNKIDGMYNTSALLPKALKDEIPEIKYATGFARVLRLSQQGDTYETFQLGDKSFQLHGSRAGSDFFKMFSYPLLYGNAETCLSRPDGVAISKRMAELFFDDSKNAIGKSLSFNNESERREVMVTAVFDDLPSYSSDRFDYLTNWDYWVEHDDFKKYWGHFGTNTYVELSEGTDITLVHEKLKTFLNKYINLPKDGSVQISLKLQPFGDFYLHNKIENGEPTGGRIMYVRAMTVASLFILVVALINFTNLSTAQSLRRLREVGVRKAIGANKNSLLFQFIFEHFALLAIAIAVAILIVQLILPWFNVLVEKQVQSPFGDFPSLIQVIILFVVTGIISGVYPAKLLSSSPSISTLTGTYQPVLSANFLRKSLVVFQFYLSIVMIGAALVVASQTSFLQGTNIGYDRENILYFRLEGDLINGYQTFKKEALQIPGVKYVDRSAQTPHAMGLSGPFVSWEGMDPQAPVSFLPTSVGFDFIKLMGLKIMEGRDFSEEFKSDTAAFIFTESAIKLMGIKNPIGSKISVFDKKGVIVGIANDYHGQSLHQNMLPIVMDIKERLNFGTVLIKIENGQTVQVIERLQKLYATLNPGYALKYSFIDEEYARLYHSEQIVQKFAKAFCFITIVISCLGLLGIAMLASTQRLKEMSIRKVFGASLAEIFQLFSLDFLKIVFVAIILGLPTTWFLMNNWLSTFAYHIKLGWLTFFMMGAIPTLLALFTIGFHARKIAVVNPIETLKRE